MDIPLCSLPIMYGLHVWLSKIISLVLYIAVVTGSPASTGRSGLWADDVQKQATFGTDAQSKPQRHPYGFWDSPLSPEWMVSQVMHQEYSQTSMCVRTSSDHAKLCSAFNVGKRHRGCVRRSRRGSSLLL